LLEPRSPVDVDTARGEGRALGRGPEVARSNGTDEIGRRRRASTHKAVMQLPIPGKVGDL